MAATKGNTTHASTKPMGPDTNSGTLACTLAMLYLPPAEHCSAPRSASSVQTATARLPPRPSAKCVACTRPGNA
ncbi:hypothetical protein DFH08DRAFT_1088611, partial [Mycena albidolilacea]